MKNATHMEEFELGYQLFVVLLLLHVTWVIAWINRRNRNIEQTINQLNRKREAQRAEQFRDLKRHLELYADKVVHTNVRHATSTVQRKLQSLDSRVEALEDGQAA